MRARGGQLWGEGGTTKPGTKGEETQKVLQKTGCLTCTKVSVFVLSYPQNKRPWHFSPSEDSSSSGADAVMHLHIVKLAHILSLQAEVSEAQCDHVTLLNRYTPYTQLENIRLVEKTAWCGVAVGLRMRHACGSTSESL